MTVLQENQSAAQTLNAGQDIAHFYIEEATLAMLDILSQNPPFSYMDISSTKRIEEISSAADSALKYVGCLAMTIPCRSEESSNYADAIILQRYTAVFGHPGMLQQEYQTAMPVLQNNQTETKLTAPRRLCQNVRNYFPWSFPSQRAMPGCLPEQFRSVISAINPEDV